MTGTDERAQRTPRARAVGVRRRSSIPVIGAAAWRSAALATLLCLAVARPARAQAVDRDLRENQRRLEEIQRERDQLQAELARLRGRAQGIAGELGNLERQKGVTGRLVNELDRLIGSMRGQLDTVTLELILAQDALAEKRAVLERRLADI